MVLEPANIRSLLIRAWRERWSDIQWGIHIKTVLPRYISGDIYQLSDCLLQQALMGTLPNHLILSYLRHSLASQIVSFGGVMESISKYDRWNKTHCIQALLHLMESMMKNINCKGKSEDCLMLASSIVAGVNWLIQVMTFSVEKLIDLQSVPEYLANLHLANLILKEDLQSQFFLCMVHIGCKEDSELHEDFKKRATALETILKSTAANDITNKTDILKVICELKNSNPLSSVCEIPPYDITSNVFCTSISTLLSLEVVEFTTRDAKVLAQQLVLVKEFKGLSLADLYFEILRSCFIGLSSFEYKLYQELKWVGFTYIKIPSVINHIHKTVYAPKAPPALSEELLEAITRLSDMVPLLDVADFKVNCNCLECLMNEFIPRTPAQLQGNTSMSVELMTARDVQTLSAKRLQESNFLPRLQKETQGRPGNPDLILRAHPTVASILKTLINKHVSDSVLPVLKLLISGKSRELLLVAAASSGNLHIYAQRFVRINEQCKDPLPEESDSKAAANRAFIFDISFLLCCHIAQVYGIDVVVSEECNTFIEQWIKDNIPERGKIKVPSTAYDTVDNNAIQEMIVKVNSVETDKKYSMDTKHHLTCKLSTIAIKEMICAAQQDPAMKQSIFDLIKKFCYHLCSLSVCLSSWLCSHIQQASQDEAALCLEYLQYLQSTMMTVETTSNSCLEVYKDRSNLMCEIIVNMTQTIKGPVTKKNQKEAVLSFGKIEDSFPLKELTKEFWDDVTELNGQVSHKALAIAQDLIRLGGSKWFVTHFVKSAMSKIFENDLTESIDIVYGLFNMNIVDCTLNHIVHVLPSYISGRLAAELNCEPRTSALAKLTAMLLVSCWVAVQPERTNTEMTMVAVGTNAASISETKTTTQCNRGIKRSFSTREIEEWQEKFNEHSSAEIPINIKALNLTKEGEFFLTSVFHLFKLISQVTRTGVVSPVSHLIVFLLKELLALNHSTTIISLIPPSTISNLAHLLTPPLSFEYSQLLALSAPQLTKKEKTVPLYSDVFVQKQLKDVNQVVAKLLCVKRNFDLNASA